MAGLVLLFEGGLEFVEVVFKEGTAFMAEDALEMVNEKFMKHFKRGDLFLRVHVVIMEVLGHEHMKLGYHP